MSAERLQGLEPALLRTLATVETHPLARPLERALHRLIGVLRERERDDAADAGCDLLQRMCDAAPTAGMAGTALGHASITTTRQVYGHLEESFLRGAADRVERLIWAPADASDGADDAGVVPRVVPRPPGPQSDAA